jgi:hypothetical protein
MANGRNKSRKKGSGRDPGGFVALPWSVLDCPAFFGLSHPARSLLLELARQFVFDNNGRLLASTAYLAKRGWKSCDVITRAKRELIEAGFIHEMVKGHRPNKASWYALTWQTLDRLPGYDAGAAESFQRGAYQHTPPRQNAPLTPAHGTSRPAIAPSRGATHMLPAPPGGAMRAASTTPLAPSRGNPLEMPSAGKQLHH